MINIKITLYSNIQYFDSKKLHLLQKSDFNNQQLEQVVQASFLEVKITTRESWS